MSNMKELVQGYLSQKLDRRGFINQMALAGFGAAAAQSVLATLAPMVEAAERSPDAIWLMEGTGGELLVAQLKAAGIKHVFWGNGSPALPILDAMFGDDEIHLILCTDEGHAMAMASGYAMASNEPTFVNVTTSVGTARAMGSLFNAHKDSVPVLLTANSQSTGGIARDGFEDADDLVEITKQFTRWGYMVPSAARIPEFTRNALRLATTPRTGPTFLNLPGDALNQTARADIFDRSLFTVPIRSLPDPRDVERAADMILAANRPMMYLGEEIYRSDAYDDVLELAELAGLLVVQGFSPYTDFPTDHPLYVGDSRRGFGSFRQLQNADLMLNMGGKMPYQGGPRSEIYDWRVIQVRNVPDTIGHYVPVDLPIVADVKATARALIDALSQSMTSAHRTAAQDRIEEVGVFKQRAEEARRQFAEAEQQNSPVSWSRLAIELNNGIEEDAIITHEMGSGSPRILPWMTFGRHGKKELIGRTMGSGLGWSVPAAVGIKMATPDRQVIDILGDGAFLYGQVSALWMAKRFEAPVMYVVLNNRSYNDTRLRQAAPGTKMREEGRDFANYLGNPDVSFEKLANGFEIEGATVRDPGQLAGAIERGVGELREGRPFVLDVEVERIGALASSTYYPRYSVAEQRTRQV